MAPADKAANNVVVVLKRYYISTLTYEHNKLDETSIVYRHRYHMAAKFGLFGCISCVLLLILVHVQLLSCLFF